MNEEPSANDGRTDLPSRIVKAVSRLIELDNSNKTIILLHLAIFVQGIILALCLFAIFFSSPDSRIDASYVRIFFAVHTAVLVVYLLCLLSAYNARRLDSGSDLILYVFGAVGTACAMFSINAVGTFTS
ncbi:MAG: hypothetical protein GY854_08165, partial [Deltaproteobacteria bacterium]|nr:hypothetical protein [Deltaproteobacteria bacterium]